MMIRLYHADGRSHSVPEIDSPGWLAQGWAKEPFPESEPAPVVEQPRKLLSDRHAELMAMEWFEIKELVESYKLPTNKPRGESWVEYGIPLILSREGYVP